MRTCLLACLPLLVACSDSSHASTSPAGDAAASAIDGGTTDAAAPQDAQGHAEAGGDASFGNDAGVTVDRGPARQFRLATGGAQLLITGPAIGLQLTEANVVEDSDVMAVHQEFYGLPWDSFEADTAPPPQWVAVMDRLANSAKSSNKPVFLSISMLTGSRQSLAAKTTIEQGQVKTQDNWSANCYDFASAPDAASKRAAYLRYVAYMVERFSPAYLNIAIEVNLFFEKCPAATAGLIELLNTVYAAAKKQSPETLVFPSFQIDHLYGYSSDSCADPQQRSACFDAHYATIAPIKRDRFAMSSYPYMSGILSATDLPADWFTRGAARGGETALIAETGWPSTPIVARARDGSCHTYFSFDEATSAAYLARVLGDARDHNLELVTWWSNRDLLVAPLMTACPCTFDATWCTVLDAFRGPPSVVGTDTQLFGELLLKAFGTMGLRSYDGTPKPLHQAQWREARTLPYAP